VVVILAQQLMTFLALSLPGPSDPPSLLSCVEAGGDKALLKLAW